MPAYKFCGMCPVVKAVETAIMEYQYFLDHTNSRGIARLPDHTRGYNHGKTATLEEVVTDLKALLPHMVIEAAITGGE